MLADFVYLQQKYNHLIYIFYYSKFTLNDGLFSQ